MTGRTLSHYRVIEQLGKGAHAVVYLAEDLVLGRAVVLKLLPQERSADTAASQRFLHEARTASSLNHPNICTIYEIAEAEGRQFIVMERLDGRTLAEVIASGPIQPGTLIELAVQVADALDAAHSNGIVHRDIKPPNIVVTRRGQAVLLDFGIAVLVQPLDRRPAAETGPGAASFGRWGGTLAYMSPEQLRGEELDGRSDLFSLGAVLHEMATGRPAFSGGDIASIASAILTQSPAPLRSIVPAIPQELERIVGRALEPNRQLRYQTAADLRADLQRLQRDLTVKASVSAATPIAPTRTRRRLALAAAAIVTIAAATTGWALVEGSAPSTSGTTPQTPAPEAAPEPVTPSAPSTTQADIALTTSRSTVVEPPRHAASLPPTARGVRPRPDDAVGPGPKTAITPAGSEPEPAAADPALAAAEAENAAMEQEMRVARAQLTHQLDEQALATLRDAVVRHANSAAAVEGYFLMASIEEPRKPENAMATYVQIADRFAQHARAPEALFRLAELTLRSKRANRSVDARAVLEGVATRYAQSPWATRALVAKGNLEERDEIREHDAVLAAPAPAAIASYRRVLARNPGRAEHEHALWRLAVLYEDLKRYDLAADTWTTLAERYADTPHDAWASAARLYERRLKDPSLARAAYARVPSSSPSYRDAQKRLSKP
jgi:serine/threonine protein kinase